MGDIPVVIVSGASRGVGAWVARWLGKAGAGVTLIARSGKALRKVAADVERLGGLPWPEIADVSDPDACARAVDETVRRFGHIDSLVNNAAVFEPVAPLSSVAVEGWRYNIEVNLLGPFYLIRAAIPELRGRRGRVVNVSSGAATTPIHAGSAYCAAKAGLNHVTRVLALEEPSVTAIAMRPGVVDTEMQALIRRKGPNVMPAAQIDYYQRLKTAGRLEHPSIPARSIAWLALHAPSRWSGEFLNYDDPRISQASQTIFGESPQ